MDDSSRRGFLEAAGRLRSNRRADAPVERLRGWAERHYQTIWLLAQGQTVAEVSALTSFAPRWIEELLARCNSLGPKALGKPDLLAKLTVRLK